MKEARSESVGDQPVRVTVFVRGQVQGVGFRWWTRARALELGLAGQPSTTRRPGHVSGLSTPLEGSLRDDLSGFLER
jgi:acylphosphatase